MSGDFTPYGGGNFQESQDWVWGRAPTWEERREAERDSERQAESRRRDEQLYSGGGYQRIHEESPSCTPASQASLPWFGAERKPWQESGLSLDRFAMGLFAPVFMLTWLLVLPLRILAFVTFASRSTRRSVASAPLRLQSGLATVLAKFIRFLIFVLKIIFVLALVGIGILLVMGALSK